MGLNPTEEEMNFIAKPSSGGRGLAFVEELDTLEVSASELSSNNGSNHHRENRDSNDDNSRVQAHEEVHVNEYAQGVYFDMEDVVSPNPTRSRRQQQLQRSIVSVDILLSEDELEKIFDDVFTSPEDHRKQQLQVSTDEIAFSQKQAALLRQQKKNGDFPPFENKKPSKYQCWPMSKRLKLILSALFLLFLIGLTAWAVGRVESNHSSSSPTDDESSRTTVLIQEDDAVDALFAHFGNLSTLSQWNNVNLSYKSIHSTPLVQDNWNHSTITSPLVQSYPNMSDILPNDHADELSHNSSLEQALNITDFPNNIAIRQYLIGIVQEPIQVQEIQSLLDRHRDWKIDVIRVKDGRLDTSGATVVLVDDSFKVQCGVKVDSVPLTFICDQDGSCAVYTLDGSFCNQWE